MGNIRRKRKAGSTLESAKPLPFPNLSLGLSCQCFDQLYLKVEQSTNCRTDYYSDAYFWQMKGFPHSYFAPVCRPACVLFATQRWTCFAIQQANEISVRKLQISDGTINFRTLHVIEAGEQRKATKFGRQVLLSSCYYIGKVQQNPKFGVLWGKG